ncbi:MAG TPA: alpha/beta hydrolase [Patescibacteria group bacterium]|nr:alpha/beta hydrolase [Patescibacteria group bacterium]
MLIKEDWIDNKGVMIHYLDSNEIEGNLAPIFICPGLSESAEDYTNLIHMLASRRCIVISFRGRGKSDCPDHGYSLEDHERDIEAVVNHLGLKDFYLMGNSRGVSYTIDYATRNNKIIKGLIIVDYPALHKKMAEGWADGFFRAFPNTRIKYAAILGIERESREIDFNNLLHLIECPTLVMRGVKDSSLLTDEAVVVYLNNISKCRVAIFEKAGHRILIDDFEGSVETINTFLRLLDESA